MQMVWDWQRGQGRAGTVRPFSDKKVGFRAASLGQGRAGHCAGLSVSLMPAGVIREEGTSIEKMPPSDWPVGKSVGIFLING